MKKIILPLAFTALCLSLSACSQIAPKTSINPAPQNMPGSDRDAHGCIPSAGYQWCAHTQQCERPWILAKQQGIPNTEKSIQNYCNQPVLK